MLRPALATSQATSPGATPEQVTRVIFLSNTDDAAASDLITSVREISSPEAKMRLSFSQHALIIRGTPEQVASIEKLVHELDRPITSYRLSYAVAEMDGAKQIGIEHYSMVVTGSQKTDLHARSRVPVVVGSYTSSSAPRNYSYQDVGLDFTALIHDFGTGLRLDTKVEDSTLADSAPNMAGVPPLTRHEQVEGSAILRPGKPLTLGSIDFPGSTRRLEVSVTADPIR